ncbi:MAG: hypothetical protein HC908_18210 [Calothrix sp. SM1_7_51]|nr:hypothetical protein [Calothrix sp. SM1_7_51]
MLFILLLALTCPLPLSLAETIDNPVNNALKQTNPQTKQIKGINKPFNTRPTRNSTAR